MANALNSVNQNAFYGLRAPSIAEGLTGGFMPESKFQNSDQGVPGPQAPKPFKARASHQLLAVLLTARSSPGQLLHFQLPDLCSTDLIVSLECRDAAAIDCVPLYRKLLSPTSMPHRLFGRFLSNHASPLLSIYGWVGFLSFSLRSHLAPRGVQPIRHRPFTIILFSFTQSTFMPLRRFAGFTHTYCFLWLSVVSLLLHR